DPIKALDAARDAFMVMPMIDAAKEGDLFVTITGDIHILRKEHFELMKDGAIVANSGHFNVEINIGDLEELATSKKMNVRKHVDKYVLKDGRSIYLLAQGRLINLAAAEGHPASVMDMSFATQALTTEHAIKNKMPLGVHEVPQKIDNWVALAKLESMGVIIDELTEEQKEYLASWEMGT
ncbi:MAG: adenosylhomocysteinase, partial [Calditrichia bacterium]